MKKIISVMLVILMVVACNPTASAIQVGSYGFDTDNIETTSFDALLDKENFAILVDEVLMTAVESCGQEEFCSFLYEYYPEFTVYYDAGEFSSLACGLVDYFDYVLAEKDLNSEIKEYSSLIAMIIGGTKIDLNSVDGVLETTVGFLDYFKSKGTQFCGDLSRINSNNLIKGSGRNKKPITSKNSSSEEIIDAVLSFVSSNNNVIKTLVSGNFDFGSLNGTIKSIAGVDLESDVNNYFINFKENVKTDIYDRYLKCESETEYEASAYNDFSVDEIIAAVLYKICTGNLVLSVDELAVPASVYYEVIKDINTFSQQYRFNIGMFSPSKLPEFILSMLCNEATVRTEITADEDIFDDVMCNEINKIFALFCNAVYVEPERLHLTGESLVEDFIVFTADIFEHRKISEHIHIEEIIPGFAATCKTSGLTDGVKCSICDEILVEQTEITIEHDFDSWITLSEVTCSQDGIKVCSCNNCSEIKVDNTKAYGHFDQNSDGKCDDCSCLLEHIITDSSDESSENISIFKILAEFFNKIINFFKSLFGL